MNWSWGPCQKRATPLEWMDTPDISDEELESIFQFIEKTDRILGGYQVLLDFLKKASRRWNKDLPVTLLDLYCGRGELAVFLLKWAKRRKWDLRILSVDRYGRIVQMAKEAQQGCHNLSFDTKDWNHPDFLQAQQFDYVVSHLSLHHLEPKQIPLFIKRMHLLAKRGLIVTDWIRDIRAWASLKIMSQMTSEKSVQHDGPLAIKKGFTLEEISQFIQETKLTHLQVQKHFGYRFSISTERGLAFSGKLAEVPA